MIASGWTLGSRTTLAIRVFDQRPNISAWQLLHLADPTYARLEALLTLGTADQGLTRV